MTNDDGVPIVNGKLATLDESIDMATDFMADVLSAYRCPECGARLSAEYLICLNACHLSVALHRRMNRGLNATRTGEDFYE